MENVVLFLLGKRKKIYYRITGGVLFRPKEQFPHKVALGTLSDSPGPSALLY